MNISRSSKFCLTLWKLPDGLLRAVPLPAKPASSSRCCQLNHTCMAAASISCTTPAPQRSTVEPFMNTLLLFRQTPPLTLGLSPPAHRSPKAPVNWFLYWPPSPKRTVAPSGVQVRLIPAFTYQTSVSFISLTEPKPGRVKLRDVP